MSRASVSLRSSGSALVLAAALICLCQPLRAAERPAAELPLLDPAARLADFEWASEYWDLTIRLASGHAVFARFLHTHTGPGDGNAVVTGHVLTPEGSAHEFRNGRRAGRWKLSEGGRRLDVGSSHLDLSGSQYRLEIDKKRVKLDLRFAATGRTETPPEGTPVGYRVDLLASSAPVKGSLWLKGMQEAVEVLGPATLVHTEMPEREAGLVLRRIEFFMQHQGTALYLLEILTPMGKHTRWMNVSGGDSKVFSTTGVDVTTAGDACVGRREGPCSKQTEYWVPKSLGVKSRGFEAQLRLEKMLLAGDPLELRPGPIRWVISMVMRPHRVWAETAFDVTLWSGPEHLPIPQQGSGIAAITFLNAVAQP
jgi:hypothetical protein